MSDESFINPTVQQRIDAIVATVTNLGFPAPAVVPSSGDAQLEWHDHGADIEIYISRAGAADVSYGGPHIEAVLRYILLRTFPPTGDQP